MFCGENGFKKVLDNQDYNSGAGSDELNVLDLGEINEDLCQIDDQTCGIPFELYDLLDLKEILSMDVWNNLLTDDDRISLAKYLPDLDQGEIFMQTMKELFSCGNFHFGIPSMKLFDMLKGGLCEPRVTLYRKELVLVQKRYHYHVVKQYQNTMVDNLVHIRESLIHWWEYDIHQKLQLLNLMKNVKTLTHNYTNKKPKRKIKISRSKISLTEKSGTCLSSMKKVDPVMYKKFQGAKLTKKTICRDSSNFKGDNDFLHVDGRMKQCKGRAGVRKKGGRVVEAVEAMKMLANAVETESEQFGETNDDDDNCLIKTLIGLKDDMATGRFVKKRKILDFYAQETVNVNSVSKKRKVTKKHEMIEIPKVPITFITPTVHTGFPFSIIHLLSAIRVAMNDTRCLTVEEIVNRVKSNPGDPSILETQEPLHDLIRGFLKIFSSKRVTFGVKGLKTLVLYENSTKNWSWTGPVTRNSSYHEAIDEVTVTSPDAWGLPYKTLVNLVDTFANWLKNNQDTLKLIGSLPAPPLTSMQINLLDEKERFKDLKRRKGLSTITQSSNEVKDYFRKEELIRYLIPDRVFSYTAVDGKKSSVAPLKEDAGKPTSKLRNHFMLKRDQPPHVNVHCLVRDAAARLPGSIGTRGDVCTLIRDSQYIVEDISDAQLNPVVSAGLDRLHYERDPWVRFIKERKLWIYLHREREEDFEIDGTFSSKRWKRQKKQYVEP